MLPKDFKRKYQIQDIIDGKCTLAQKLEEDLEITEQIFEIKVSPKNREHNLKELAYILKLTIEGFPQYDQLKGSIDKYIAS
jgi:hypothetical protein